MLNQILGEKNSVKRMILHFSLGFILVMMAFGAMILFQSHIAIRQYDEIVQNIVSVEESKELVRQIKLSAKKYVEARNARDYTYLQADREELDRQLDVIEELSREQDSLLAIQDIRQLLEKTDSQVLQVRGGEGKYDYLARLEDRYDNMMYLLDRVQNLEANHAAEVYPQLSRDMASLTKVAGVIYVPIIQLVRGVREISKGNFQDPDIKISSTDEFDYLATAVNGMKRDLSHLIETREAKINAERLLKETQFLALQSQVNPHFLFNVLAAATASALVEGADKTLDIVESISYMLRYSLQSTKTSVSLRDEIKMVQTYLFLQNQRFGDRITFSVEFDEEMPDVPIPGMTVQPIVENAVVHGCEKLGSGGWLKVTCRLDAEGPWAVVTVENNGGVLTDAQLQAFYAGESIPHSGKTTGIGLVNVRDRMRYFYDRQGLMDCAVEDGAVTVVTLRYPAEGGDSHEQREIPGPDRG